MAYAGTSRLNNTTSCKLGWFLLKQSHNVAIILALANECVVFVTGISFNLATTHGNAPTSFFVELYGKNTSLSLLP